jgi:hypothetical protein
MKWYGKPFRLPYSDSTRLVTLSLSKSLKGFESLSLTRNP